MPISGMCVSMARYILAITYLKLSGLPTGLLVNFHTTAIKHGLRRLTNKNFLPAFPPSC